MIFVYSYVAHSCKADEFDQNWEIDFCSILFNDISMQIKNRVFRVLPNPNSGSCQLLFKSALRLRYRKYYVRNTMTER